MREIIPTRDVGRPTVMTEEVLQKLEEAFINNASDEMACFLANICPATLYNYQKDNPDFLERKRALKDFTTYRAKLNLVQAIDNGDMQTSAWWVERKAKDEFSTRTENANLNINVDKNLSEEEKKELERIFNAQP